MTKEKDNYFIGVFRNELQRYRLIVGVKNEGDTMESFLKGRALEQIQEDISKEIKDPINKFDAVSEYLPVLSSGFSTAKAKEVRAMKDDYKPKTSLENMVKYLKDSGYVCYKKKK